MPARTPVGKGGQLMKPKAPVSLKKRKRPSKGSKDEIEERRRQVLRLRMRGLGYRTIGKLLGVGHMTVKRDLEAIREDNRRKVGEITKVDHVSEALSVFQEVELRAWQDYHEADAGSKQRQSFLSEIREARKDQTRLLTELGLIEKAAQESKVTVSTEVIRHWSVDAQDLVAMAILKSQMGVNGTSKGLQRRPDKMLEAHAEPATEHEDGEPATAKAS